MNRTGGEAMSHYYQEDKNVKDELSTLEVQFLDHDFVLETNHGVFSKDKLDTGTKILLETISKEEFNGQRVCDLGCGIGVVGVLLHAIYPKASFLGIDTNERACRLATQNYEKYQVKGQVLCQDGIHPEDGLFDDVVLNPPIRAGKEVIYKLFEQSIQHLNSGGSLWIVIRKQHGAASAVKFLESLSVKVERLTRDKGFWIVKATKTK